MKAPLSFLAIFIIASSVLVPSLTFASECEFSESINQLNSLKDSASAREQLLQELSLRKKILNNLSTCFIEETTTKKQSLDAIAPANPEAKAYQRWLTNQFTETISFYEFRNTQIKDVGLQGSKNLAKTLLDRRQTIDKPLFDRATQFSAWNTNQELFLIANKRLLDITATLEVFDLPAEHELGLLLIEAKKSLTVAEDKNRQTWEALKLSLNSDNKILPLIKSSLEALAESYNTFFEISELSKKELPL